MSCCYASRSIPNTSLQPSHAGRIRRRYLFHHKLSWGAPIETVQEGSKYGVHKINIDTDIRLAMTGAIRRFFAENPGKFDPREYLKPAREAAKAICVQRYQQFGTAGNASKIKVVPLTEVATQYAAGKLAQVVQ